MHAELDGLICNGPRHGKQHTYALLDDVVPPAPERSRHEALAELALRFFRRHGPATVRDCSWWSGLTMTDIKAGLAAVADDLVAESDENGAAWYSVPGADPDPAPVGAHFIQTYDELGVAYKDQRMFHAAPPPEESLWLRPVLVEGRAVGSWSRKLTAKSATLDVELHAKVNRSGVQAIRATDVRNFAVVLQQQCDGRQRDAIANGSFSSDLARRTSARTWLKRP